MLEIQVVTAQSKKALLLLNLGSPASPEPKDVGEYLKEFLMDPFVIDIPAVFRWILVHWLVIPKRSYASSELYKKVWTEKGSPLVNFTKELTEKVQRLLGEQTDVRFCMRYGSPSIESVVDELKDHSEITLLPLYPQYSLAASESSEAKVREVLKAKGFKGELKVIPAFYREPLFLDAVAEVSRKHLGQKPWDKVLFSFHGLPERQVKKLDPTGSHCRADTTCCESLHAGNQQCYRAQCYFTAKEVAKRLGLNESQYLVAFQSRLGRTPWIKPHSDLLYESLPKEGVKRLAVLSPSFVADCLETLEEIEIRGKKQFQEAGGHDLFLVPCLNSEDVWAESLKKLAYQPST